MAYQPDRFDEVPEYTDQRGAHRESFAAAGATATGGGRRLSPLLWVAGLVLLAGLFVGVVLPWLTGDRSEPVAAESSTTAPAVEPSPSPSTSSESSSASSASASTASATESATPSEDAAEASRSAAAAESSRAAQEAAALEVQGFGVQMADVAPTSSVTGVVVHHARGDTASARTVAAAYPGAKLKVDPQLTKGATRLVIGAGAVGLACAFELTERGLELRAVIDALSSWGGAAPSVD